VHNANPFKKKKKKTAEVFLLMQIFSQPFPAKKKKPAEVFLRMQIFSQPSSNQ
jgi:hypothetical protein